MAKGGKHDVKSDDKLQKSRLTSATMGYKPAHEWAEMLNMSPNGLYKRFKRHPDDTIDDILRQKNYQKVIKENKKRQTVFVYHGKERSMNEICSECGISSQTFRTRVKDNPDADSVLDAYKRRKERLSSNRPASKDDICWNNRHYTRAQFCKLCNVSLDRYFTVCKDPINPTLRELQTIHRTNKVKVGYAWYTEKHAAQKLGLSIESLQKQIKAQKSREFSIVCPEKKKSRGKVLFYEGREWTIKELSEFTGIKASTIASRVKRGWSIERLVTQPLAYKSVYDPIEIDGEKKSLIEWCRTLELKPGTVYARVNYMDLSPKEALLFKGVKRKRREK